MAFMMSSARPWNQMKPSASMAAMSPPMNQSPRITAASSSGRLQ